MRSNDSRKLQIQWGLPPSQLRIGIVYAMWNQYFAWGPWGPRTLKKEQQKMGARNSWRFHHLRIEATAAPLHWLWAELRFHIDMTQRYPFGSCSPWSQAGSVIVEQSWVWIWIKHVQKMFPKKKLDGFFYALPKESSFCCFIQGGAP